MTTAGKRLIKSAKTIKTPKGRVTFPSLRRKSVFAATVAAALGSTSALAMDAHGAMWAKPVPQFHYYHDGKREPVDFSPRDDEGSAEIPYIDAQQFGDGLALIQADYRQIEERIAHTVGVPREFLGKDIELIVFDEASEIKPTAVSVEELHDTLRDVFGE